VGSDAVDPGAFDDKMHVDPPRATIITVKGVPAGAEYLAV
jgi:hypothetical protein